MYSLHEFGEMVGDTPRFRAYTQALERAVRPGHTVVDLGCGPGVFALQACLAGARRVFAIDLDGVVDFGRQLAADNRYSDKIEFLRGDSRRIHLPERANVIISDVRGAVPLFSSAIETVEDARNRFLAENGRMIPEHDTMYAAMVEAQEIYDRIIAPWKSVAGVQLGSAIPLVLNTLYVRRLKENQVVTSSEAWHELEYMKGANPRACGVIRPKALRKTTAHGIAVWFATRLMDEIGFSTAPGPRDTVYGHVLLPLLEPVVISPEDEIEIELKADLVGTDYVWRWNTRIKPAHGRKEIHFQQSTFLGGTIAPSTLRKRSGEYVPVLTETGLAERWLLTAMDGRMSLDQIALDATKHFPHVFRRPEEAFRRAGEIAEQFSR